jgi:hypothetical protein
MTFTLCYEGHTFTATHEDHACAMGMVAQLMLESLMRDGMPFHQAMDCFLHVLEQRSCDPPPCDVCACITIRSGQCYKCLNCGNSMGAA